MMTVRTIHRNSTRTITKQDRRDHHPAEFRKCQFGERRIGASLEAAAFRRRRDRFGHPVQPLGISVQCLFDISDQVISTFDADAQP